jgi:hypothetical protein
MTLTEHPEMTKKKMRRETRYFTTGEVLEVTGLSFRVLDYWLRTGAIRLTDGTMPGSGVSRRYSLDEVAAIQRLVDRYNRATDEIEAIRSGKAWATLTGDGNEEHVA